MEGSTGMQAHHSGQHRTRISCPCKTGLWKVNGKTVNQVAHLTVQVQAAVTTLDAAGYWLLLLKQQFFSKHQPGLPSHLDGS
mmetsp:Transcript_72616/g.143969  ORF Transcript_72616/g.143969 Transcript_72616/m.143969 type:complete len:82 (+) Transcript_72616:206-451(+)